MMTWKQFLQLIESGKSRVEISIWHYENTLEKMEVQMLSIENEIKLIRLLGTTEMVNIKPVIPIEEYFDIP